MQRIVILAVVCLFLTKINAQENVSVTAFENEFTVGIYGAQDGANYSVGYGTQSDNLTYVMLALAGLSQSLEHVVHGLDPGVTYHLEVTRDSVEIYNDSVTTTPLPPRDITILSAGTTSLLVAWDMDPSSTQDSSRVIVTSDSSEVYRSDQLFTTQHNVTGLEPGTDYTVAVVTISKGAVSHDNISIEDNTVPSAPVIKYIQAIDGSSLMLTWNTEGSHDNISLTATYNSTLGVPTEVDLYCTYILHACITDVPGQPGETLLLKAFAWKNKRMSEPDQEFHSTKPNPILGIAENSSSTAHLHLKLIPPVFSKFDLYNIDVYRDNGSDFSFERNISVANGQTDIFLLNLTAGMLYNVSVVTRTSFEESDIYSEEFTTYPMPPESTELTEITNSTVTISWEPVVSGGLDYYRTSISPKEAKTISPLLNFDANQRTGQFTHLVPGKKYSVSVMSGKGKKTSPPVTKDFWTEPNPPSDLNVTVRNGREIDVDWAPPEFGYVDYYTLHIQSSDAHTKNDSFQVTDTYYRFMSLHPGETYFISVTSHVGDMVSPPITVSEMTNPSSVAELYIDFVGTDIVNVSWPRPNGSVYDTFELEISPADVYSPIFISESSKTLHYSFSGLKSGTYYIISIYTSYKGSRSDQAQVEVVTDPVAVEDMNVTSHDPTTLNVEWRVSDPSQQHHFIVLYHDSTDIANSSLPMVLALHDQYEYSAHILSLEPGHFYKVFVQAKQVINDSLVSYSDWQYVEKSTKPNPVRNLTYQVEDSAIMLSWLPGENSTQDKYFVWYRAIMGNMTTTWKQNTSMDTETTLVDLFPGLLYEMVVFAVSHGEMSLPRMLISHIPPLPPSDLQSDAVNTSTILLAWTYMQNQTFVQKWELSYSSYQDGNDTENITIAAAANQSAILVPLNYLTSGHTYNITVYSVVLNTVSESVALNVTVVPENNAHFTPGADAVDSITVRYTEEFNYFEYYKLHLINSTQTVKKNQSDENRTVTFSGLEGGTLYEVKVVTVSGDQQSEAKFINIQTLPNTPTVEQTRSADTITLIFNRPSGQVDSYTVLCTPSCGQHTQLANKNVVTMIFDDLEPYTQYHFQIVTVAGVKQSSMFLNIQTEQAAPTAVQNLKVVEPSPLTVNLTWNPPSKLNGVLTAYLIRYQTLDEYGFVIDAGGQNMTDSSIQFKDNLSVMFQQLKAGRTYTFQVYAKTVAVGLESNFQLQLRTYHPPLKEGVSASQAQPHKLTNGQSSTTFSTISANFTNAFSDKYGPVLQYAVIVATDTDEIYVKSHVLPDWKAARNDPSIKAYQAMSNCSNFFEEGSTCGGGITKRSAGVKSHRIFVVGSEENCGNQHYCNGPLKENTAYYIRLRAYTAGGYSDTIYSTPFVTDITPEEETPNNGGIIAAVIVSVVLIIALFIAVIFVRRRIREKSTMSRHTIGTNLTPRSSVRGAKKNHCVRVADFLEYIKSLSADSDFKYAEQFEDLKNIGRDQSCHAAELPVNRGKNRFTNILPYDHSRVKLLPTDDEEGSDYINANYMPGFSSKREYIVTQGPLPSTRDDYWRMIWEQNTRNIVMLTRCMEKGREKCDHYWPMGSDAMFYGDLQVATLSETRFPSWTITEFRVAYGDLTRQVRHFHFTAWPDFGVPDHPQTLIRFVRTVREQLNKDCGPILVHCSAGVGRSGTFIVLDRILQHIQQNDTVDIFGTVYELRKERVWMVQTEQQYICIHKCLECVLEGTDEEHIYENVGVSNAAYEDDEGINVEVP